MTSSAKGLAGKKLVMVGCLESGWEIIKYLLENGIRFSHFVCISPEKAKEMHVSGYKDFGDLAQKYDVPIYYAKTYNLKNKQDVEFFEHHQFDLLVQGGWQRLFPEAVLEALKLGAIGLHGSPEPLPKGRGRSPINWALIRGNKRLIMHYFLIKPGIDDGDVFYTSEFDITPWDDCRTLFYKYSIASKYAFLEWIPKLLSGDYKLRPQTGEATYNPKRSPEDGRIDWSKPVLELYDFIRAQTKPYPGAFSLLHGEKVQFWKAQPFDTKITYPKAGNGEVVEIFSTGDFVVNCKAGLMLVTECEPQISGLKVGDVFRS